MKIPVNSNMRMDFRVLLWYNLDIYSNTTVLNHITCYDTQL